MQLHNWRDDAACLGMAQNNFFEDYENDVEPFDLRTNIDNLCCKCPCIRDCFVSAKYFKENGVWAGIYMNDGETSVELNKHKTPDDWAKIYVALTE